MSKKPSESRMYKAPKLIRYGDVSRLTASGTGSKTESNTTGQPFRKP